ncbi:hypothetical protein CRE_12636 [Caenorhabditis remanei]|uniref:PAN-3 domain-containing protein n=1 Tax=Caenorhabditis remanei TaxID=31234 RepID=E3M818_CAERE|nr:hypothetical protein CRE_12636 [Caenorhabditis remanei]
MFIGNSSKLPSDFLTCSLVRFLLFLFRFRVLYYGKKRMILIKFILFLMHSFVTSELTMMLVYGVPNSLKNADLDSRLNWTECIQSCYNSQPCVMAWQVSGSCATYEYSVMGSVTKTDSSNGSIVAFKVETTDGECPIGSNPPTFNNQNATGSLYIDYDTNFFPKWVYYTIYLKNNSCTPSDNFIEIVERSDGSSICVTGYYDDKNTSGGYSYDNSVEYCNDLSTHPTGVWYPEDAAYFPKLAQKMLSYLAFNNTYIRIDGIRTTACQSTPSTAECMSVKGFNFTGPPVENFDYYDWVTDSSAQETLDDNCIVMVVNGSNPLKMDVRSCFSDGSPFPPKLIFCSCPAWIF